MRLYGITAADMRRAAENPIHTTVDDKGNPRLTGLDHGNRAIIIVVANDDADFVITTFPDD